MSAAPLTGTELRAIRKNLNLSQTEFARLIECDPSNLSAMELGKRGVPKSVIAKLNELRQVR